MKIPAVAIAAAFVGGIVLGLNAAISHTVTSLRFLIGGFIAAGLTILAGLLLVRLNWLAPGAGVSLLSWIVLGILSAGIALQPLPSDHVAELIDGGQLDLHSPLR